MATRAKVIKGTPGRPTIPREQKRIGFSLYLKAEVLTAIEVEAAAHGISTQMCLRNYVETWALDLLSKQRTTASAAPEVVAPPAEETEMAV